MSDDRQAMTAVSPLDGRYAKRTRALSSIVSESALHRYRVRVEVEWFLHLAAMPEIPELSVDPEAEARLRRIWQDFDHADAEAVRALEAETNHDVKAVEYFVKEAVARADEALAESIEFVHFACTSEDINNVAYALMMQDARDAVLGPAMDRLIEALVDFAAPFAEEPMLARTHGQAASPTTVGKELANVVVRLRRQRDQFKGTDLLAKMNGAVGNYNAHVVAYPGVDWPARNREFI
ncbi:MAG: adenylosuccinate lyase, partial [Pseudomonadales bacterium]|nr:adenylosuccinate lyase [Pseudomonadales bacterium]